MNPITIALGTAALFFTLLAAFMVMVGIEFRARDNGFFRALGKAGIAWLVFSVAMLSLCIEALKSV
jgi:isoprenylcysteine carboxyl methyltransferase (ICMT) family protein YpbQ